MDFSRKKERKRRPGGAQMETKMKEFREHFAIASQEPSRGGFGEGSGWIWGGFWEGFGGILRPLGGPNGHENQYISKEIQVLPQDPPRKASGRVLGGFAEFWGRFWAGFRRIFQRFFNTVGKVFLRDLRESSRWRLREFPGNLANPMTWRIHGILADPS